jgi:antibiotic biosynthesis monooxygenase (ABM) superfamily enzyme
MIVRQVTLKIEPRLQAEFVSFWKNEYRAAMSRQPGFLAARLLKVAGTDDELQLELEFDGERQASAWRASPEHARLSPRLKSYSPVLTPKVLSPLP